MKNNRAFTLIEVLVTLAIVAVMAGLVTLSFSGFQTRRLRDEADRLAFLIQTARQEAILENKPLLLTMGTEGYDFHGVDAEGALTSMAKDEIFRERKLPSGILIETQGRLFFQPTGELPDFQIIMRQDKIRWQVAGTFNGRIAAQAVGERLSS